MKCNMKAVSANRTEGIPSGCKETQEGSHIDLTNKYLKSQVTISSFNRSISCGDAAAPGSVAAAWSKSLALGSKNILKNLLKYIYKY